LRLDGLENSLRNCQDALGQSETEIKTIQEHLCSDNGSDKV